ncbi:MAG: hypothetical protein ACLR23_02310 [Clostridia bacterium]
MEVSLWRGSAIGADGCISSRYQQRSVQIGALDFDDLLIKVHAAVAA